MRAFVRVIASLSVVAVSACGSDPQPAAPTPVPAAFLRVDIDRTSVHDLGFPGDSLQLRAIASFDDGSRVDVTNEAAWSVVNPEVLSVSARGLLTAVDYGGSIVSVAYRNRAGEVNVSVRRGAGPVYTVTGVVVDAQTGAPVVGAIVGAGEPCTRTDGNGFFQCVLRAGSMLTASSFGYADASLTLPDGAPSSSLRLALAPNPGSYIERTTDGDFFEEHDEDGHSFKTTVRINTRAGGVFDAWMAGDCDYNGQFGLSVVSGGVTFTGVGPSGWCYARLRFTVPASECLLTMKGYKTGRWRLTYREPR